MMPKDMTPPDRFWPLVEATCLGTSSKDEQLELQAILRGNSGFQRLYLEYCRLHSELRLLCDVQRSNEAALAKIASPAFPPPMGVFNIAHSAVAHLSSGWPMAYLVATVMTAIGLLTLSHTYILSNPSQVANLSPIDAKQQTMLARQTDTAIVGQITSMVDCEWAGSEFEVQGSGENGQKELQSGRRNLKSPVRLGDHLRISSGLLEISYESGAKVLLQGPVTYEVDSPAGGYLAVGKLTARLEKKKEAGIGKEERSVSSSSLLVPGSLFAVRTPSAVVADLGTGVRSRSGRTRQYDVARL